MNENMNPTDNYTRLSGYCFLLSVLGAVSYLLMFPAGIYYGFFCGVTGACGGILTRRYSARRGHATAAIVIGMIDIVICLVAFHGLNTLYSSLRDPVLGPQMTQFILNMLNQYGVSADTFSTLMHP
ncbi:MAG: hypothetical protein IJ061_08890 [Lachnospiraceae bacterium]|nr:hypothetical protein [Lachnospiraceae bacterium]